MDVHGVAAIHTHVNPCAAQSTHMCSTVNNAPTLRKRCAPISSLGMHPANALSTPLLLDVAGARWVVVVVGVTGAAVGSTILSTASNRVGARTARCNLSLCNDLQYVWS